MKVKFERPKSKLKIAKAKFEHLQSEMKIVKAKSERSKSKLKIAKEKSKSLVQMKREEAKSECLKSMRANMA